MANPQTVMTRRESTGPERARMSAITSDTEPNITVKTLPPYLMILVRVARVYVQSLLAALTAGGLNLDGGLLPNEFGPLIWRCVQIALLPAFFSLMMNAAEILSKLDITKPELRA